MSPTAIPGNLILKNEMVEADPFFNNVSLLLHGDGANGSTTIVDSSSSPKAVTAVGDAQISTAQSKFGGTSIQLVGAGAYVSASASADYVFTEDFTIEFWFYNLSGSNQKIPITQYGSAQGIGNWGFYINSGTDTLIYLDGNSSSRINVPGVAPAANSWTHVALVRSGGTCVLYYNGIDVGSRAYSGLLGKNGILNLGTGSTDMNAYIDDLRITKGIARYTANFTPPTAPFPEVLG